MTQDVQQGDKPTLHARIQSPVTVPFRMINRLIILPVQINGSDTLQFIFDTGLETSIICELEADEVLELKQAREILVRGFGSGKSTDAIQSKGNSLRVGDITIDDQDYIVLSNNVLELSRKMGTKIHGLLNMQAFQEYLIEIDFEQWLITFHEPGYFSVHRNLDGYTSLPMDIINGTPFINAAISTNDGLIRQVKLMLDTGTGNALSLDAGSLQGFSIPKGSRVCYLGCGINGIIEGKVGRIKGMEIGPFHLQNLPVSFPDSQAVVFNEAIQGQNGSLGSELLRRFNLILDYPDKKIHIMANKTFNDEFYYDMSGLEIQIPVPDENRYIIAGIRKQSRAELAGIRPGDEILSINGTPAVQLNLDEIYKSLHGNHGKKIRLELLRENIRIRANFRLEKYI
jgi:hypothetical protein